MFSVHITRDGQILKNEVDILGDCTVQSTIEFENTLPEESWNSCLMTENCHHKESLENTNRYEIFEVNYLKTFSLLFI